MRDDEVIEREPTREELRIIEINAKLAALRLILPDQREAFRVTTVNFQKIRDEIRSLEEAKEAIVQGQLLLD